MPCSIRRAALLTFASAGHPWLLLCHGNGVRPLHTDAGLPLGLLPCQFREHTVTLCRDFRLLFYTDGISEALNCEAKNSEALAFTISLRPTIAAFTNHCSLFVLSWSLLDSFNDELRGHETSKGTLRFPLDKPLPVALVKKLVEARLAHNERRKQR